MPTGGIKVPLQNPAQLAASFENGQWLFSPGLPPEPTSGQMPTRSLEFPTGYNQIWTPRSYEPFSFPELRAFSNVELVRLAIETRKDQISRLDWCVKTQVKKKPRGDADERIAKAEKLFRKPDGRTRFADFTRHMVEDMLSIDATALERRRNKSGDVIGLDLVDGSTIKLLVDEYGRTPFAPLPAYQQVIKGVIWNNLTTDDMIYAPRNIRAGHLYGFGPVEQVIVTTNTLVRRQALQLAQFTDSNIPAGFLSMPDEWTPDQLKEWQDTLDARLAGNLAQRSKLLSVPSGTEYQTWKESPIKDEFDEWLARIICYAFNLPPTPFVKSMNRGTAQEDQDRALEEGLEPILRWLKGIFDGIIQDDLGLSELEFSWVTVRDIDIEKQSRVHDVQLRNGTKSINEVRDELGMKDMGPEGDKHYVYVGNACIPVDKLEEQAEATIDSINQPPAGPQGAKPKTGNSQKPKASSSSPSPQRKTPQTQ